MTLRSKLIWVILCGLFVATISSLFIIKADVSQREKSEKLSLAMKLRRTVSALIESQNDFLADRLVRVIEQVNTQSNVQGDDFLSIGLINIDNGATAANTTQSTSLAWLHSFDDSVSKEWVEAELKAASRELNVENEKQVSWARIKGPNQQIYFAMATPLKVKTLQGVKSQVAVGILPISIFSSINVISKGDIETVFAVSQDGYTFSYPDQKYVGSKIESHPIVAAMLKSLELSEFSNGQGHQLIGGYERVPNSNLSVIVTVPVGLMSARQELQLFLQLLFVFIGVAAIVSMLVFYVTSQDRKRILILEENLRLTNTRGDVETMVIDKGDLRMKEFAKAVFTYLRKPLTAMTSLVHLIDSKNSDKLLIEFIEQLKGESRRTRDFIETLGQNLNLAESKPEVIELLPILDQLSGVFSTEAKKFGIQFESQLSGQYSIKANHEEIKESLRSIISYVLNVVAQQSNSERQIELQLRRIGGQAEFVIAAIGAEVKHNQRKKIFAPFQTPIQKSQLLGLELALAHHVITDLNGTVDVESIDINGFQIVVRLPLVISLAKTEAAILTSTNLEIDKMIESKPIENKPVDSHEADEVTLVADIKEIDAADEEKTQVIGVELSNSSGPSASLVQDYLKSEQSQIDSADQANGDLVAVQIRRPKVRLEI